MATAFIKQSSEAFIGQLGDHDGLVLMSILCGKLDWKTGDDCGRHMGRVQVSIKRGGQPVVSDIFRPLRLGRGQAPLPGVAVVGKFPREGFIFQRVERAAQAVTFRCARCGAGPALSRLRLEAEAIQRTLAGPLASKADLPWIAATTMWIDPGGRVLSARHGPAAAAGTVAVQGF